MILTCSVPVIDGAAPPPCMTFYSDVQFFPDFEKLRIHRHATPPILKEASVVIAV